MDALNQGPEQQIIDTLERLLKSPDIFYAVRIFVSRLLPVHQNNNKIAIIFHILGENNYIYKLSNQDVILLIRNVKKKQLEQLFDSIRSLFPRDPAILKNPPEYFIKTYNLKSEYRAFVQDLNKLENEEKINKNEKYKIPLTPENLEEEIQRAKLSDIVDAIRKQPVITLAAQQKIKILFYEFFTSTTLLGQKAIPNVNLLSDPWLFQHLTETLDLKVIDAIQNSKLAFLPPVISLNLNISSLFNPIFSDFSYKMLEKNITIIAEIQVRDIFSNPDGYIKAKEMLNKMGHKILLDGVNHNSLLFLDVISFNPDLIKIIWSSQLEDDYDIERLKQIREKKQKIILCRCDDEKALMWGVNNKIRLFQGVFVDKMVAALTKKICKNLSCSLAECIENLNAMPSNIYSKCQNTQIIDNPPFETEKIW